MPTESHVSLKALWEYRSNSAPLSSDELQHLYACNDCLALLGVCQLSNSIDEVERLRYGKPRTGESTSP
jgi:hypothetical protein